MSFIIDCQDIPISFPRGFREYTETFLPALLVETLACLEQDRGSSTSTCSGSSRSRGGCLAGQENVVVSLSSCDPLQTRDDHDGTAMHRLSLTLPVGHVSSHTTRE